MIDVSNVTDDMIAATRERFEHACDERIAFERAGSPIVDTILDHKRKLARDTVALTYFAAVGETFAFVNWSLVEGKRFNEKGIVKAFDLAVSVLTQTSARITAVDMSFFMECKRKGGAALRTQKDVANAAKGTRSSGTVSTQISSFLQSLRALGLAEEGRDAASGRDAFRVRFEDARLAFLA